MTLTRDVSATGSETFAAYVRDQNNKAMQASVSIAAPAITVTVMADQWSVGRSGSGRVEVKNTDSGTVVVSEVFRVDAGLSVCSSGADYG